jgi:hypothetical protein
MKLRPTYIVAVFAAIYLIATSGACAFILYQLRHAGTKLQERISVIAGQHAAFQTYNELTRLAEETKADREELQTYLLSREETSSFLTSIEQAGAGLNVAVSTDALKENGAAIVVQFSLSGAEQNVHEMIHALETLPYRSSLASLTFNRKEGSAVEAVVEVEVSLAEI